MRRTSSGSVSQLSAPGSPLVPASAQEPSTWPVCTRRYEALLPRPCERGAWPCPSGPANQRGQGTLMMILAPGSTPRRMRIGNCVHRITFSPIDMPHCWKTATVWAHTDHLLLPSSQGAKRHLGAAVRCPRLPFCRAGRLQPAMLGGQGAMTPGGWGAGGGGRCPTFVGILALHKRTFVRQWSKTGWCFKGRKGGRGGGGGEGDSDERRHSRRQLGGWPEPHPDPPAPAGFRRPEVRVALISGAESPPLRDNLGAELVATQGWPRLYTLFPRLSLFSFSLFREENFRRYMNWKWSRVQPKVNEIYVRILLGKSLTAAKSHSMWWNLYRFLFKNFSLHKT